MLESAAPKAAGKKRLAGYVRDCGKKCKSNASRYAEMKKKGIVVRLRSSGSVRKAKSDQQEVPLVLAHHFAPLHAMEVASLGSRVVDLPDGSKDLADTAE
jgi:hypothetical protein